MGFQASILHRLLLASEVRATMVTEWPPACLHKLLLRGHQDGWLENRRVKDVLNLTSICPRKPIQVWSLYGIFEDFISVLRMLFFDKNRCWYWGFMGKTGSILGIKVGNPQVNSGLPHSQPTTPQQAAYHTTYFTGVYRTAGFNAIFVSYIYFTGPFLTKIDIISEIHWWPRMSNIFLFGRKLECIARVIYFYIFFRLLNTFLRL